MKMEIAIVDSNVLSSMGLQRLLEEIMPMMDVVAFRSYEELVVNRPERFKHYFVASGIYFEHTHFFLSQPHRSIVLVHGDSYPRLANLLTLNVCQSETEITKSLLQLQHMGHAMSSGAMPPLGPAVRGAKEPSLLSAREAEVAVLLAKGLINKEVADRLDISLTTVISHRKNIMDKLKAHSLADIIIHVVASGLVTLDEL